MTAELVQSYIDICKDELHKAPSTGSIECMKKILYDLEVVCVEKSSILLQERVSVIDQLRSRVDNVFENRVRIPVTIKCQEELLCAVSMAQDHFKTKMLA